MVPPLIHLIQSALKHNSILLTRQTVEQLLTTGVERTEHIAMVVDLQLNILQTKEIKKSPS